MNDNEQCLYNGPIARVPLHHIARIVRALTNLTTGSTASPNDVYTHVAVSNRLLIVRCGVFAAVCTRGFEESIQFAVEVATHKLLACFKAACRTNIEMVTLELASEGSMRTLHVHGPDCIVGTVPVSDGVVATTADYMQSVIVVDPAEFIDVHTKHAKTATSTVTIHPETITFEYPNGDTFVHAVHHARTPVNDTIEHAPMDLVQAMIKLYEDGDSIVIQLPWAVQCRTAYATYTHSVGTHRSRQSSFCLPNSPAAGCTPSPNPFMN